MKLKQLKNLFIVCLAVMQVSLAGTIHADEVWREVAPIQQIVNNPMITHTVEKGETAYSISKSYNIPIETLYALNPKAASGVIAGEILTISNSKTNQANPSGNKGSSYIVESKETLYSISKKLDISIDDLVKMNPELKEKPLYVGQVLQLKKENKAAPFREHIVSSKETLYGIARQYNTTSDAIMTANPELKNGLKVGSTIVIPNKGAPIATSNSTLLDVNAINVGLVLPFVNKSQSQGARFVEYYEGLLIALEQLKKKGFSANIYVFDMGSETGTTKLNSLLDTYEMKNLDLIIGGVSPEQIKIIADFSKKNKIKYAIPFPTASKVVENNNYVFQVNEDANFLSSSISKAFVSKFSGANVILVTDKDTKVDFIRDLNSQLSNNGIVTKSVNLNDKLVNNLNTALDQNRNNVIVATAGSSNMMQSLLTALNTLRQNQPGTNITLFGQPEWQTYIQFIPEYSKYNTYIYTPFFMNNEDQDTKEFITSYKKWYNNKNLIDTYPRYGALGYDTGIYFFTALLKYGKDFEINASSNSVSTIQTPFSFKKVNSVGGYVNTGFYFINYAPGGYIQKIAYAQW